MLEWDYILLDKTSHSLSCRQHGKVAQLLERGEIKSPEVAGLSPALPTTSFIWGGSLVKEHLELIVQETEVQYLPAPPC